MSAVKLIIIYIIIINLIGFFVMGSDKNRARHKAYRIPEFTIFSIAFILGSAGVVLGMFFFKHKTKKPLFLFGLPALLILQLLAIFILWRSPLRFVFI